MQATTTSWSIQTPSRFGMKAAFGVCVMVKGLRTSYEGFAQF